MDALRAFAEEREAEVRGPGPGLCDLVYVWGSSPFQGLGCRHGSPLMTSVIVDHPPPLQTSDFSNYCSVFSVPSFSFFPLLVVESSLVDHCLTYTHSTRIDPLF